MELIRLTVGSFLQAIVLSRAGKETFLLQTPVGQLSVQSAATLPKGAALTLQILSLSPAAQLRVRAINGVSPALALRSDRGGILGGGPESGQTAAGAGRPGLGGGPEGNPAATGKAMPLLVSGAVVKASLLRTPAPLAATPPATAAVTNGGAAGGTGKNITGGGQPSGPTAPAAITGGGANRTAGPAFPVGTQLNFRIAEVQLPNAAASNVITPATGGGGPAGLAVGKILTGVITGATATGHPVVQTEAGVFALNAQPTTAGGGIITLVVTSTPRPAAETAAPALHPGTDDGGIFRQRRWPALDLALQELYQASPAAVRQLVHTVLPRPDIKLTASLLFFLSALKGGDILPWFGPSNMRLVGKNKPGLSAKLSDDFGSLRKIAHDPIGADWRVALIPINTGFEIAQIRMLLRRHDDDQPDGGGGDQGARFILDVELSRLGRIQLDGLVRGDGKKLDLIIRSADTLSDENRSEIRRIFGEAAALTGIQGGVVFQASPPNYIDIPDPLADHKVGLLV